MLNVLSVFFILIAMVVSGTAQASFKFGQIIHAGPGCKQGDAPKLSLKKNVISIDFASLRVSGKPDRQLERSTCQLRIPVELEPGFRLKLSAPEISGTVRAPSTAEVILRSDIGMLGQASEQDSFIISEKFSSVSKTRRVRVVSESSNSVISECGREAVIRLNNEVRLQKPEGFSSSVTGQVRSVRMLLEVERCDQ